jgi:hypothetical protein
VSDCHVAMAGLDARLLNCMAWRYGAVWRLQYPGEGALMIVGR